MAATPARSQTAAPQTGGTNLKQQQDALFQQVLKQPGNLDISFRYAEVSTKIGDLEAAVGALERMLFFNPNLPRVRLELGVLYFRLGSYEMAKSYFEAAIKGANPPPEVVAKVQAYLAEIAKRLNPNRTSVFAQTGIRYQTNANAGPSTPQVRVLGLDATLDKEFVKSPDANWFAQAVLRHVYDLGNQRGDTWETTITGYFSRQFEFDRLDTGALDFKTGPRLALFVDDTAAQASTSIRPYISGLHVALGDTRYLDAGTLGASTRWIPKPGWAFEVGGEYSRRVFANTRDYPTAKQQTGHKIRFYTNSNGPLIGALRWQLQGVVADTQTKSASQDYLFTSIDVAFPYAFRTRLIGRDMRFTITPFAGFWKSYYEAADPLIDPDVRRRDRAWHAGLGIDTLVSKTFGFGLRARYSKTVSNLPNFRTDNLSVLGGPTIRF